MAINTVYQPPAGLMGEYAYQSSAVKQVRDNLDTSIARNMQAQQFNAGQRMDYARMGQQAQQYQQNLQQNQQQFDANRFDRNQQFQAQQTQGLMQDYNKSRSDFDDIIEDGVKNGWLKLEPEQKQELRKLSAADTEVMMRDDLDEGGKVRMLQAIQTRRRNIIPSVIPGFDRPSKTFEMAEQNTFIIGEDGVARAPVPGQRLGPNEQAFFMGKRGGENNPVPLERPKKDTAAEKPVSDKYWSPELDYSAKYAKSVEQLNEVRDSAIDGYKSQFDEASSILKDPLQMGDLQVTGPDIQPVNGNLRMKGERVYNLRDPQERLTYQTALRLLKVPGVAYTRDDVLRTIQTNDSDHIMGQAGDTDQQGPMDEAAVEQMLQDKPPGIYTIGGYSYQKD
jgi:hypothetical protein